MNEYGKLKWRLFLMCSCGFLDKGTGATSTSLVETLDGE